MAERESTSGHTTRFVVVTGATGGIGRAIVRRLASDGYGIVLHYASSEQVAAELRSELIDNGVHCVMVGADLRSELGIRRVIEEVDNLLALDGNYRLHGLVNNAAKLLGPSLTDATFAQFNEYVDLNARAPFFLIQQISRMMARGGSIVNLSSAGAHFSSPGDIVYAMSKAAVESLTKHAAEELAHRGLRINAVIPGFTDNGHPAFRDPQVSAYMSSFSVMGGISQPEVVADAVAFLLSEGSVRTTGSLLDVSGGSTLGARPKSDVSLRRLYAADEGASA